VAFFRETYGTNTGMYDRYYKEQLYPLQDKVLAVIGPLSSAFYLTGGTALSRFLLHHRYSDDLDFFVNRSPRFHQEVDDLYNALIAVFPEAKITVRQDSYVRIMVTDHETSLKLEFVNDVGHRVGKVSRVNAGLQIDSWENILSNKVTALARLAGKDYVDVLFLAFKYPFNWEHIMDQAKMKDAWINEINVSQLFSAYSPGLLDSVRFPSSFLPERIQPRFFETLARDSLHGLDNSLFGQAV
jgi:hypothetical protein